VGKVLRKILREDEEKLRSPKLILPKKTRKKWSEKITAKRKKIMPHCGRHVCLPQVDRFKMDIFPS
jgi:hypothetical protein